MIGKVNGFEFEEKNGKTFVRGKTLVIKLSLLEPLNIIKDSLFFL